MNDPNFKRSVILLTEHSALGTVGFVLNHPTTLLLKDLIPEMEQADFQVFTGGPVELDTIHFIHRCYDKLLSGDEIAEGIYWGGNFETLKILIANGDLSADEVKFFIGYSGWGEEQLNMEIKENTWIVSEKYQPDLIFSVDEAEAWREVIVNLGPRYAHISKFPENPNLN